EVEGILRRSVLDGDHASGLPVAREGPEDAFQAGQVVDVAAAQPPTYVEEGQSALEMQVALVLRARTVIKSGQNGVGVVEGLRPHEAGQKRKAFAHALLPF